MGNDPAVSHQVRARFREALLRAHPQAGPQLDAALARDWQAGYAREIARPNQLDPRNLADSHAAYLIAGWALVNDVTQLPPQGIAALRDAVRQDLASRPEIGRMTAGQRQALGEMLNLNTVLVIAQRQRILAGDRALREAAARHYADQFAAQGGRLRGMRLFAGE